MTSNRDTSRWGGSVLFIMKLERKRRGREGISSLEWADVKHMSITVLVIREMMRVASILPFTFRETVQDVELSHFKRMESFASLGTSIVVLTSSQTLESSTLLF